MTTSCATELPDLAKKLVFCLILGRNKDYAADDWRITVLPEGKLLICPALAEARFESLYFIAATW
ncbi:hypothetical protein M0G74_06260 [Microbulbifer sp. CAU 1566]|uniref:hypothetical protein n=1 Tax=Microbulbifer sp. CAU 1566 TaxID=2933269 RepID=UPI0020061F3E|nr:hypothetical protein [Microbulbifer sp. CAU 1566]MCK7596873.1 hypothetical protein [Microbulbifer sp. CAU 1566]